MATLVNSSTAGEQFQPASAVLSDGRQIVFWTNEEEIGGEWISDLRGQFLDAGGIPSGSEFLVHTRPTTNRSDPSVTALADGGFVLAWTDSVPAENDDSLADDLSSVRLQRYDASGAKVGAEIVPALAQTAQNETIWSARPVVEALAGGGFAVAWFERGGTDAVTDQLGISGRVYLADGRPASIRPVPLGDRTSGEQGPIDIAALPDGGFVMVWQDRPSSSDGAFVFSDVWGRLFDAAGTPRGPAFMVPTETGNDQRAPSVASLPGGRFVVAWEDWQLSPDDNNGSAIRAQIFNADGGRSGDPFLVNTETAWTQSDPRIAALDDGRFLIVWTDRSDRGPDRAGVRGQLFDPDGGRIGAEFLVNTTTGGLSFSGPLVALDNGLFLAAWTEMNAQGPDQDGSGVHAQVLYSGDVGAREVDGTPGADAIAGTVLGDTLSGLGGNDTINAASGNDLVLGGEGDDTLDGGTGNDTIVGGPGDDEIRGGPGANRLNGVEGNNRITGGELRDVVFGGVGRDTIDGAAGNDELHGLDGDDVIFGGLGSDTIYGGSGADTINGGGLSDEIYGGAGDDYINGGFGFDRMNGGAGADVFFHLGVFDHGADWIQDYLAAEGDVLAVGIAGATRSQFQINIADTPNAGAAGVAEAFVIYRPTGQILFALVDGDGQSAINLRIGAQVFDLMA